MASPFSVFRKRQKLWMAIACLLAIISFVFLPNLGSLLGRGDNKGREDLVVVKTKKFGDLRQSNLSILRWNKQKVRAVLIDLRVAAGQDSRAAEELVNRMFGSITDDDLVDTWLKVRRAQEVGMVVSDDAVTRFLEQWTALKVEKKTIQQIIERTPPVSEAQFCDLLREELLPQRLMEVFAPSIEVGGQPIATPSQRWDWFNRVNRMAVIEAVPLAVANYVKDVKDPADDVLEKFFEEHNEVLPNPTSPQPGFKRPQKVAIEYFKADIASFAAKVTDAEVLKEYEKNKDVYDQRFRIPPPEPPKHEAAKAAGSVKKENAEKENATKPKPESKPTKVVPNAKTPAIEPNNVEPKKEPATPKTEKKEPNKTSAAKGTSSADGRSPFMLTAMQAEKSPAQPPKSPAKPEKQATKVEKPATIVEQKPADKKAPSGKKNEGPIDELPVALKTFIRQRIAVEKIQNAFEGLSEPVKEYQEACKKYDLLKIQYEREKKQVPASPTRPDFEKLAKANGLLTGQTKLLSEWESQDTDIGGSLIGGQLPVYAYVYKSLSKYRSMVSIDGNAAYLFWKNDDVKDYVPKFDDKGVREEVLRSWKLIQARSIARKAAKSLADEANKAAKPLKQVLRNRMDLRVALPPKFSWMTITPVAPASRQRPQLRISPVADVPMAGDDFMSTVFQLEPGQTDVAFNIPETVVYVVRPSEFTPLYKVRWLTFLADSFGTYSAAGGPDQLRVLRAWGEEIKKSAGFEWGPGHKGAQAGDSSQGAPRQPMDDED